MIIQNSAVPYALPASPVNARSERSDPSFQQNSAKSGSNAPTEATFAARQESYQNYDNRILAARKLADANAYQNATHNDNTSSNIRTQQALAQYLENADSPEAANREQIQLLFGIDVVA